MNYLQEFVVLADVGNYLEAAEQLYISQSALSRHIKAMENELGILLFDRNTRKIELSKFGEILYPYALSITQTRAQYQAALFDYKKNILGTLSIGSIPAMAQYKIIDLLFLFQQENSNFSLNLIENDSLNLIEMVRRNDLELAFIRSNTKTHPDFVQILYTEDPLVAVMPAFHKFADRKTLRLSELTDETLLLLDCDTFMYQFCVNECSKAGFEPKIGYTGKRSENILAMVEKGAGVALLTQNPILHLKSNDISIVEITPRLSTWISLIYRKDKKLGAPAKLFVSLLESQNAKKP
nr:LysR family transcriptional regulator [Parablautia muri]